MTFLAITPAIYFNVKAYGAAGDGVTDDTTAIAAAVTAAGAAGGGTVYLPPGTYVTSTITLPNHVWIRGAGMYASIIYLKNGTNSHVIQNFVSPDGIVANAEFVGVLDLTINGNKANQSGTSHGIYLLMFPLAAQATNDTDFDSHQLVQNVFMTNVLTDGLNANGRSGTQLHNVQIYHAGHYGFNPSFDTELNGCVAGNCGSEGFYLQASSLRLTNCKSFYSGQTVAGSAGFHLTNSVWGQSLSSCEAQDNTGAGFLLDSTQEITMSACVADSNSTSSAGTYPGLDIFATTGSLIEGFLSFERRVNGSTSYQTQALRIRTSSTANRISLTHYAVNGATVSTPIVSGSTPAGNDIRINQQNAYQNPAFASSYTPDPYTGSIIEITLTGNITINNVTDIIAPGCTMILILKQDGTGGRTTSFGTTYKTNWTPTTTLNKTNAITLVWDGTNWWQTATAVGM